MQDNVKVTKMSVHFLGWDGMFCQNKHTKMCPATYVITSDDMALLALLNLCLYVWLNRNLLSYE